ncbi:MAG TPA: DUF6768 family protein [Thermoanaerobaculia bacterium]|nr:DUF6768 family protein [Thermoanaerobaculia bacterium]
MTRDPDRNIDDAIRRALSDEEREFLADLDDPSLQDLVADTFRGRLRFFTVVSWVSTLVFVVLMFYSAYRMLGAEGRGLVLWQTATVFFMLGTALTKLWVWLEIHRKSLLRELKRIELRLVELGCHGGGEPLV